MELRSGTVVGSGPMATISEEGANMLVEGIRLCFSQWTALQLAVENEWGGRTSKEKAVQLQSDILGWFVRSKGPWYIDDLEQLLDESMIDLFSAEAEDGSVEEVAEQLMVLHEECTQGNYDTVRRLSAAADVRGKPAVVRSQQLPTEGSDDEDENVTESVGHNDVSTSHAQGEFMDIDPSPEHIGQVASNMGSKGKKVEILTEEDMADGWQAVPSRHRRRNKQIS